MNDVVTEVEKQTGLTTTEGMVQALLPHYMEGDKKATYLGYLVAGFSKHEAVKLADIHKKTVTRWTQGDPDFVDFVNKLPEVRKELGDQLLDIEFTRNFRLVLAKDFKILYKDATGKLLSDQENNYLQTIRKFYTPQHLVALRQLLVGGDGAEQAFDWTKAVLEIRLSREEFHGKI